MAGASESIWLRTGGGGPGPQRSHSLDQIAAAAVALADSDGLPGLSMRAVAAAIDASPAALYRYVTGKDDLLDLMADRVAAEYRYPAPTGAVVADVLAIAEQSRLLHRRHPWLRVIGSRRVGPHTVDYLEHMVAALAPGGLDARATMLGIAMVSGWVTIFASQELAALPGAAGVTAASTTDLAVLAGRGDHPHLSAVLAEGAGDADSPVDVDDLFRIGIESLVHGIVPREDGSVTSR